MRFLRIFKSTAAGVFAVVLLLAGLMPTMHAQEKPYFVTYSHDLEEPGNLEIESQNIAASPKNANAFFAPTVNLNTG